MLFGCLVPRVPLSHPFRSFYYYQFTACRFGIRATTWFVFCSNFGCTFIPTILGSGLDNPHFRPVSQSERFGLITCVLPFGLSALDLVLTLRLSSQ